METDVAEHNMKERYCYLLLNLVGNPVQVSLVDGSRIEGVFVSENEEAGTIILGMARYKRSSVHAANSPCEMRPSLIIEYAQIMSLDAVDVAFRSEGRPITHLDHLRHKLHGEKPLERWANDTTEEGAHLEDDVYEQGQWDQFAINEQKFGVKSSYHDEHYTTKLDKKKFTPEQIEEAERKARAIERSQAMSIQHRVDRGEMVDVDEGALYSDVQRTADDQLDHPRGRQAAVPQPAATSATLKTGSTGAYVPPSRKGKAPGPKEAASPPPLSPPAPVEGEGDQERRTTVRVGNVPPRPPDPREKMHPKPLAPVEQPELPMSPPQTKPKALGSSEPDAPIPVGDSKKASLNAFAQPFVSTLNTPTLPGAGRRVIENMVEEMSKALHTEIPGFGLKIDQRAVSPEWPGDNIFFDEDPDAVMPPFPQPGPPSFGHNGPGGGPGGAVGAPPFGHGPPMPTHPAHHHGPMSHPIHTPPQHHPAHHPGFHHPPPPQHMGHYPPAGHHGVHPSQGYPPPHSMPPHATAHQPEPFHHHPPPHSTHPASHHPVHQPVMMGPHHGQPSGYHQPQYGGPPHGHAHGMPPHGGMGGGIDMPRVGPGGGHHVDAAQGFVPRARGRGGPMSAGGSQPQQPISGSPTSPSGPPAPVGDAHDRGRMMPPRARGGGPMMPLRQPQEEFVPMNQPPTGLGQQGPPGSSIAPRARGRGGR